MRKMPQCTCKLPRCLIKYWEFLHWQSDLIRLSLASLSVSVCTFNFLWDNATSMTKYQEIDRSGSKCPTCRRLTYLGFTVHTISKLQDMFTRATFGFHFENMYKSVSIWHFYMANSTFFPHILLVGFYQSDRSINQPVFSLPPDCTVRLNRSI